MVRFAKTTAAPVPKNIWVKYTALVYAGILIVMALTQLFKFEEFVPLIASFWLGGGEPMAKVIASILVISEVFALPFLLRMYLSPAMRVASMLFGWLAAGIWLYMMYFVNGTINAVEDAGFLGTVIPVPMGWWCVSFAGILALLAGWSSWGMWPITRKKRARNQESA